MIGMTDGLGNGKWLAFKYRKLGGVLLRDMVDGDGQGAERPRGMAVRVSDDHRRSGVCLFGESRLKRNPAKELDA